MRKLTPLILAVLLCGHAEAAYRVYQLKITTYDYYGKKVGKPRVILSTLDYLQYEHYHGGYRRMHVQMLDTWYCPGDTRNFRPYCPKPRVVERAPSSLRNDPKRVGLPYNRQPVIP